MAIIYTLVFIIYIHIIYHPYPNYNVVSHRDQEKNRKRIGRQSDIDHTTLNAGRKPHGQKPQGIYFLFILLLTLYS